MNYDHEKVINRKIRGYFGYIFLLLKTFKKNDENKTCLTNINARSK